jgi:mRNA interferase MazF
LERRLLWRGDVVTAILARDYGKPRPAVILQAHLLSQLDSVFVCPFTTDLTTEGAPRILVRAADRKGLREDSVLMMDKLGAVGRQRCGERFEHMEERWMNEIKQMLRL